MLSNKDFLGFMEDGGGKKKFSLEQVKQWDQQNANAYKKNASLAEKRREEGKTKPGERKDESSYRDRAQERRLDANPDYDPQFNIVEKLDAEQTQYLGGDTQHTHLVKGLDYALLRKVRQQQQEKELDNVVNRSEGRNVRLNSYGAPGLQLEVSTKTTLGFNIKEALKAVSNQKSQGGFVTRIYTADSSVLQRTAYDYDVDIMCEDELPTTVIRSQELAADLGHTYGIYSTDSSNKSYIAPPTLLKALTAALDSTSLEKKKTKRILKKETSSAVELISTVKPQPSKDIPNNPKPINIFDDVDPSSYKPSLSSASSLRDTGIKSIQKWSERTEQGHSQIQQGYFEHSTVLQSTDQDCGVNQTTGEEKDLMAPVLHLLRARQAREIKQANVLNESTVTSMIVEEGVAHRDILGGGVLRTGGRDANGHMGESLTASTSYDLYPDTGSFEPYDSDTDNPGEKVSVKSAGTKGSKTKKTKSEDKSLSSIRTRDDTGKNQSGGDRKRPKLQI